MQHALCLESDLGKFIVDDVDGAPKTIQQQSFQFGNGSTAPTTMTYPVRTTGYYCVGITSLASNDVSVPGKVSAGAFRGHIDFHNRFAGFLPAAEHPKVYVYFALTVLYGALACWWMLLCYKHREQLVTVQHFVTGTMLFLVVEMALQWLFYEYCNTHPIDLLHIESVDGQASATAMARFLLVLVNVLDAARNSLSFFLLLIVAMGYGVVRPVIGPAITRVRVLTALHFFFGVLYAVGLVLLLIDSKGAWIFMFVFPLIITLTIFLVWTLLSLRATIVHLTEKRQTHKCAMFQRLYLILAGAVIAVNAFFFASAFLVALSGSADFSTNSWKYRWIMLDGWLAVLYFVVFTLIAWLWRPTGQNMRLAVCCAMRR